MSVGTFERPQSLAGRQPEETPGGCPTSLGAASSGKGLSFLTCTTWLFLGLSVGVALAPLLTAFGRKLWSAEHYRFAPLLFLAACWLAVRRYRAGQDASLGQVRPAVRFVAWVSVVLLSAAAVMGGSPYGAALAALVLIPVAVYEHGGAELLRRLLPAWALCLIAIPPPFGWDQQMVVGLQQAAAHQASGLLDLAGIRHLPDGVVIRVPGADFFVDEACSGVHSLFAALAFAGVFAVAAGHSLLRAFLLLAASVVWVVIGNAGRIFSVVVLSTRWDLPVTEGWGHEALGLAVFAVVAGLIVSTDRLLSFLFPARPGLLRRMVRGLFLRKPQPGVSRADRTSRVMGRRTVIVPASVALAFVGLATVDRFLLPAAVAAEAAAGAGEELHPVPEQAVPASWEGWRRVGFGVKHRTPMDPAGEWSRIWSFRKGRLTAAVSLDGPYPAWHNLEWCYDALGFETVWRGSLVDPSGRASDGRFSKLLIQDRGGRHGLVLFKAYTHEGKPLSPPEGSRVSGLIDAFQERLAGGGSASEAGPVYQVQLFAESRIPFTASEQEDLEKLFHGIRRLLTSHGPITSAGQEPTADPAAGEKAP